MRIKSETQMFVVDFLLYDLYDIMHLSNKTKINSNLEIKSTHINIRQHTFKQIYRNL